MVNVAPEPNFKKEFDIIDLVLTIDNRNYMVWGYRLDLLELRKLRLKQRLLTGAWDAFLDTELAWAEAQIAKDIRNNSAWNYRFNVVKEKNLSFEKDFAFVTTKIRERVSNEAAWNYFNGLGRIHPRVDAKGLLSAPNSRNVGAQNGLC